MNESIWNPIPSWSFTVRKEVNLITTEPSSLERKDWTDTLFLLELGKAAAANLIHCTYTYSPVTKGWLNYFSFSVLSFLWFCLKDSTSKNDPDPYTLWPLRESEFMKAGRNLPLSEHMKSILLFLKEVSCLISFSYSFTVMGFLRVNCQTKGKTIDSWSWTP